MTEAERGELVRNEGTFLRYPFCSKKYVEDVTPYPLVPPLFEEKWKEGY